MTKYKQMFCFSLFTGFLCTVALGYVSRLHGDASPSLGAATHGLLFLVSAGGIGILVSTIFLAISPCEECGVKDKIIAHKEQQIDELVNK